MALLHLSTPERAAVFGAALAEALPDLAFHHGSAPDPAAVRYVVAWTLPSDLFERHPNIELVISIGAGIDQLDPAQLPAHVSLVRMLESGLAEQMVEYVLMATLALHRDLPLYLERMGRGEWRGEPNRAAAERRVGVMGTGRLGGAVLEALRPFGFPLAGWSRSGVAPEGVEGFTDLEAFLARTDLLICLLPLTAQTEGILAAPLFSALPRGARLVHAGRGRQLKSDDLLAALDDGRLDGAVLDVVDPEPLPAGHPLWRHPKVIVTPHVACRTRAADGARHLIAVIRAHRAGLPIPGLVDRARGY